jgi:iron complex outermembrane receptor protein
VGALYEVSEGLSAGASLARAFRTPAIEELYSNGPHLADFSFNIGNPELGAEVGYGAELFLRVDRPGMKGSAAVYRNAIRGFIHHAPTGEMDPRFRLYPVYRAEQTDAHFLGAESALQWELSPGLVVHGQASYVRATRDDDGGPLPAIPPLHGGAGVRYDRSTWFAGLDWTGAARQGRVGEFETPTDGYHLLGADAGVRWVLWNGFHTVTLRVDNLTDAVWRSHLSRIRAVAPQPGRNVKLLYSVTF